MDHSTAMRRTYDLIHARAVDGFRDPVDDGVVEHGELPGPEPTREGIEA